MPQHTLAAAAAEEHTEGGRLHRQRRERTRGRVEKGGCERRCATATGGTSPVLTCARGAALCPSSVAVSLLSLSLHSMSAPAPAAAAAAAGAGVAAAGSGSHVRRDLLLGIEAGVQAQWEAARLFDAEAKDAKTRKLEDKFLATFPYPYSQCGRSNARRRASFDVGLRSVSDRSLACVLCACRPTQ
jgi:hypothetical protein